MEASVEELVRDWTQAMPIWARVHLQVAKYFFVQDGFTTLGRLFEYTPKYGRKCLIK